MKRSSIILIIVFLIAVCSSIRSMSAQEKTKEEKEKELKIQETIELQKKAMAEHKKAREEAARSLKEQQKAINEAIEKAGVKVDKIDNLEEEFDNYSNESKTRIFSTGEPFIFAPEVSSFYRQWMGSDSEKTTWDFSKSVKETTFARDYTFDVEESAGTVVMTVMGDCKAGEIRIKIIMPGGKTYSDIVIDEFGNLNWRKSFSISDTENKDKTGVWKFQIEATEATGYFKISLQTY